MSLIHTRDCDKPEHCDTATCDCCDRTTYRCHISHGWAGTLETYACHKCAHQPCGSCT